MVALLPLLATGGALVGGIQGYRRSGGNLGSALLGAGTGALTASGAGGLGRFAGSKLLGAVLPGGITGLGGQALLKAAAGGSLPAQALLKLPAIAGAGKSIDSPAGMRGAENPAIHDRHLGLSMISGWPARSTTSLRKPWLSIVP